MKKRQSTDYNLDFADDRLAALYDVFFPPPQRDDFAFYLPLVRTAHAVLDVGCGTGALLRLATTAIANTAFAHLGVGGVITFVRPTNSWFATHPSALYPSTLRRGASSSLEVTM